MKNRNKRSIAASPLGVLLAYLVLASTAFVMPFAVNRSIAAETGKRSSYPTTAARTGPWRAAETVWGKVTPLGRQVVAAPVSMAVGSTDVVPNSTVGAGQTLVTFTSPALTALVADVDNARRRLDLAKDHLEHVKKVSGGGFIPEPLTYQARSDFLASQAGLSHAWDALEGVLAQLGHEVDRASLISALAKSNPEAVARRFETISAPFPAYVSKSAAFPGVHLTKGAPIFWLQNTARVFIDVEISNARIAPGGGYSASVTVGRQETVTLRAVGTIPRIDPKTGLSVLRFSAANPQNRFRTGAWVPVDIRGPERSAIWVPKASVVRRHGKNFCILVRSGRYVPVAVQAADVQDGMVPVLSGLSAGDRVVTTGAYELLYHDLSAIMPPAD